MENLVDKKLFQGLYNKKKIIVTGHTGFKGSWLCYWLKNLGADVLGYSLEAPTHPNHIGLLNLDIKSVIGDIRDFSKLQKTFNDFKPEIVFHLAAQPLVRLSYKEPLETFETNIMGSLNLYESAKSCGTVKSIVSITTDKVYENKEWAWGYRENDVLGGIDPYSASKAAMEVVTKSWRDSFIHLDKFGVEHDLLLSTVRAGNVIGGGDWAMDRLIPDIVKACIEGRQVCIRSPYSTRPWQHVLEPLSGYLMIGQKLIERDKFFADAMNFGPSLEEDMTVEDVVSTLKKHWIKVDYRIERPEKELHEAELLKLDCTKAFQKLKWRPVWNAEIALKETIEWYKTYYEETKLLTSNNINSFIQDATKKGLIWAQGE